MISWAGLNCCTSCSHASLSNSYLKMQGREGAAVLVTENRREWCRKHATEFMRICEKNYMAATLSGGSPSVFAVMFKRDWFTMRNLVPPYKIAPPLTEEEDKEINWKDKQDFPF